MIRHLPTASICAALALALAADGWASGPGGWRPELAHARYCYQGRTTGYVRTDHGSHTYDGTPIWTDEAIAAGGWDIPLGSLVDVEDVGTFRIADRGHLAPGQVDIAVWTRAEAHRLTGIRTICVRPPEI